MAAKKPYLTDLQVPGAIRINPVRPEVINDRLITGGVLHVTSDKVVHGFSVAADVLDIAVNAVIQPAPIVVEDEPDVIRQEPVVIAPAPIMDVNRPVVVKQEPGMIKQKTIVIDDEPVVVKQEHIVIKDEQDPVPALGPVAFPFSGMLGVQDVEPVSEPVFHSSAATASFSRITSSSSDEVVTRKRRRVHRAVSDGDGGMDVSSAEKMVGEIFSKPDMNSDQGSRTSSLDSEHAPDATYESYDEEQHGSSSSGLTRQQIHHKAFAAKQIKLWKALQLPKDNKKH
jgi:hypothetical protein